MPRGTGLAVKSVPAKKMSLSFTPAPPDFIAAFYQNLMPADLALFSMAERMRMATSIWNLCAKRKAGEVKVRVYNPTLEKDGWTVDHTVVELAFDDMPFQVDSVTGMLQHMGYSVHLAIHPVIRLKRTGGTASFVPADVEGGAPESLMHIQIDHCLDPEQLTAIEQEMRSTLLDVRAAVEDWAAMRDRMKQAGDDVVAAKDLPSNLGEDAEEIGAFLQWLGDDNFTFLGYREVSFGADKEGAVTINVLKGRGLGVLRDDSLRMFGGLRDQRQERRVALRKYIHQNKILFITKTNTVTRVHRVLPMDAVFIRRFNDEGQVVSEKLFVGLFTSQTYAQTPRDIPFIRRKIDAVLNRTGFSPKAHDGRTLMHILNTYPHDELFQISVDDLHKNALGILQLQERARVAMFARRDPFGRYVTCLIYVPRDRYDSALRVRIQAFLQAAYSGKAQDWYVRLDDSRLARAFVTLHLQPNAPVPNDAKIENDLRELCRTWSGLLRESLVAAYGEAEALALLRRYGEAFPQSYRDSVSSDRAARDIGVLEKMHAKPGFVATLDREAHGALHLKLFQTGKPVALSGTLPMLENMGMKIDYMGGPYEVVFSGGQSPVFVHEFVGVPAQPSLVIFERVKPLFEEAFVKVWNGDAENDAFNALTLRVGLASEAVTVLRALARYLRQLRIPYSHEMIAATFITYPEIARQIYGLFCLRHDPSVKGDRAAKAQALEAETLSALAKVDALEDDRIIRRYLNLVQASLRTNYFQKDANGAAKPYLSIKFDSRAVDFMPLPKPLYEIFVYSPVTEGVHLRGGKVARGGIRWSDRREDFRAEILGLMKAQMVKNTVIVPVGSKGGFIVKRPPAEADKMQAEGIACYKILMRGLLDITDNRVGGKIVPPKNVVRHDGDDPYLVVAADKGTAKFSDIANGLSQEYGFWLDDAFASGGSAGYDHKGMAITARGAWEAVKRHFRELGKDIQKTPFTCIGVGDMSGDVFGNGMLLSQQTLLLGAFDHRHIFCDPSPDAAKSFKERKRLFDLPRSSWADYDAKLISKGGGVFSRHEKSIRLSPEMKKAYGVAVDSLSPADLIQAMLKAEVELIYFGGIGTYVKASTEAQDEAGDRANEALRINANEIRAKIIGEGANLGMTQRARIEYAQKGGRLNTDAIDNSAGVDTSDHEVNIKILLRSAVDKKKMTIGERNKLLARMTNDVAAHVLRDNYQQTQALSVSEARAVDWLPAHIRCIHILEKKGLLNRTVEFMPAEAELTERQKLGRGLTRPELAILLAYAKIDFYQELLATPLPSDAALTDDVATYFPAAVREKFSADIAKHQLRNELAATVVTNELINRAGLHTALLMAETYSVEVVARAFLLARQAFDLPELWAGIDALDNKVSAAVQTRMALTIHDALTQAMEHFAASPQCLGDMKQCLARKIKGIADLRTWLSQSAPIDLASQALVRDLTAAGVPETLAVRVASLPILVAALGVIDLSVAAKKRVADLAGLFFGLEKRLELGWLRSAAAAQGGWQKAALAIALADLAAQHNRLTESLAAKGGKQSGLEGWCADHAAELEPYDALIAESRVAGTVDAALLVLVNDRLKNFA